MLNQNAKNPSFHLIDTKQAKHLVEAERPFSIPIVIIHSANINLKSIDLF